MKKLISALALVSVAPMSIAADLKTEQEKISYTFGIRVGMDFKRNDVMLDPEAFAKGLADVMEGKKPRLTNEQMNAALQSLENNRRQKMEAMANENKKKGDVYRAEYAKGKGVKKLPSGVLYKVIKSGKGNSPSASDSVLAHYRGTLTNGTEFDSSYGRGQPATFPVGGVISGWQQVLQMMKPGGKWEVVIPPEHAYGARGNSGIGPNETLVFEIELLEVKARKN